MPNRNLSPQELILANELLGIIRARLNELAGDDPLLLFAYRRKIAKELQYDERGKPGLRREIKAARRALQNGKCTHCGKDLPEKYAELDRKVAADGYTIENTELIHGECHKMRQAEKRYT